MKKYFFLKSVLNGTSPSCWSPTKIGIRRSDLAGIHGFSICLCSSLFKRTPFSLIVFHSHQTYFYFIWQDTILVTPPILKKMINYKVIFTLPKCLDEVVKIQKVILMDLLICIHCHFKIESDRWADLMLALKIPWHGLYIVIHTSNITAARFKFNLEETVFIESVIGVFYSNFQN